MKNKRIIRITLVILWLCLIFIFSSFDGEKSTKQSDKVVYTVVDTVSHDKTETEKQIIVKKNTYLVRKTAHFIEFLILGILIYRVLVLYNFKHIILYSLLLCLIFASLDEIHQLFVSERTSKVFDVFIDTLGSYIGIIGYYIINNNILKSNSN